MKYLLVFITFLVFTSLENSAQQSMTLYNLQEIPQTSYQNPAFDTKTKHSVGIPILSSVYLKASNTIFQPGNLFSNTEGHVTFNSDKYINNLKDQNHIGLNLAIDLLSVSQKIANFNFSLAIRERMTARFTLPRDFLAFPFTGNANFQKIENGILDFSGIKLDMIHYRELSGGFQTQLTKKIAIGANLKYLYGYENIDFDKSEIIWKTNPQTWDWEISGQIEVNTSGIIKDSTNTEETNFKNYALKRKNKGLGIDLGMTYNVSDKLQLSASLIDLGYIKWKTNVETTVTNDAQFIYSGLNVSENVILAGSNMSDSIDVAIDQMEQDFKDAFSYTTNQNSYKTALITQLNLGANFKIKETKHFSNSLGLLIHNEFYKGEINTSFGLSFLQNLTKHFNTVLSYSIMDGDFKNLGAALVISLSKFQLYMAADNLMAMNLTKVKFGSDDGGIPIPTYSKNAHVQFGLNLVFPENKGLKKK